MKNLNNKIVQIKQWAPSNSTQKKSSVSISHNKDIYLDSKIKSNENRVRFIEESKELKNSKFLSLYRQIKLQ